VESILGPLGTAATIGLFYLPWVIVRMEKLVEWMFFLQRKLKYSQKTCPDAISFHHKSHLPDPGANPDRRSGKPATNRLSYATAST
jgi:hypothetical protein